MLSWQVAQLRKIPTILKYQLNEKLNPIPKDGEKLEGMKTQDFFFSGTCEGES